MSDNDLTATWLSGGQPVKASGPPVNMPFVARRVNPGTAHERIIRAADELAEEKDAAEKALQDLRDILDARELEAQRQVDEAKANHAAGIAKVISEHAAELAVLREEADELRVQIITEKAQLTDEHAAEMARRSDEHLAELAKAEQEGERLAAILNKIVDQCEAWVNREGKDLGALLYADAGVQVLQLAKDTLQ